jgi:tetratricopeptide (TPR) repeat protein
VTAAAARSQILWIELRRHVTPERAEKLYSEALALAERTGDRAALAGAHRVYATYRLYSGQSGADELAEDAVREADEAGELGMRIAARYGATLAHFFGADPGRGQQHAEEVIELAGDDLELGADLVGFSPRLHLPAMQGACLCGRGRLDEARKALDWVLTHDAEEHAVALGVARSFSVLLAERVGDAASAIAEGERAAEEWERQPDRLETVTVLTDHYLGVAQALSERWDEALASLDDSLARARAAQSFLPLTYCATSMATESRSSSSRRREYLDDNSGGNSGSLFILFLNSDGTVRTSQKVTEGVGGFTGNLDVSDRFGSTLANLGDLDGDGTLELAAGARLDDDTASNAGAVWILSLNPDGTVDSHTKLAGGLNGFSGTIDADDRFSRPAQVGDLDGDGIGDIAIGANFDDDGATDTGAVWVLFLNADASVKSHAKISALTGGLTGPLDASDFFGRGLNSPGDVNGDGVSDLVATALTDDDGGTDRGAAYVLFLDGSPAVCGDTVLDPLEECDDGGSVSGDLLRAGELAGDHGHRVGGQRRGHGGWTPRRAADDGRADGR